MTTETRRDYYLVQPKKFWICLRWFPGSPPFHREVKGKGLLLNGFAELDCFLHREPDGWRVSCGVTGCGFSEKDTPFETPRKAEQSALYNLAGHGINRQNIGEIIRKMIGAAGLSPRYQWHDFEPTE